MTLNSIMKLNSGSTVKIGSNITTINPTSWTISSTIPGNWSNVVYGNIINKFIAVSWGSTNRMVESSTGLSWNTFIGAVTNKSFNSIAWNTVIPNFVCTGILSTTASGTGTSVNGTDWSTVATPSTGGSLNMIWVEKNKTIYGARNIAVGLITSGAGGLTWVTRANNSFCICLAYSPELDRIAIVGSSGRSSYSTGALTFSAPNSTPVGGTYIQMAYSPTLIKFIATEGIFPTTNSTIIGDGITWTTLLTGPITNILWDNALGRFYGKGTDIESISTNGINWITNSISSFQTDAIFYIPEKFLYLGLAVDTLSYLIPVSPTTSVNLLSTNTDWKITKVG